MKKAPFKKRFAYWFDNRMARGGFVLIRLLAVFTLLIVLLIAFIVFRFSLKEDVSFFSALWDSFSTVINAWMPAYDDGGETVRISYLIMMSIAAIAGLFITSVLIGIISSAIEEKITSLKRGTSEVIEEGHIVVLGFYPGEYTLLKQLVLAAADRPCCIVVAGDMEQEEMQQYIKDNVECPKNVRIICRTVDIFDPRALERCSIPTCRSVIISPTDDFTTTKALLAVSTIIHSSENEKVRIGAIVSKNEYKFPPSIAARHNVTTLQTNETLAKIIAHSCTQQGLSETFREVFNFEGSELYDIAVPEAVGLTFEELSCRMDQGVPVGIRSGRKVRIDPPAETVIGEEDHILVFSEERTSPVLKEMPEIPEIDLAARVRKKEKPAKVTIIGSGRSLLTVLRELPENVSEVVVNGCSEEYREEAEEIAADRKDPFRISFTDLNLVRTSNLVRLAEAAEHIVILSDHDNDEDAADMDSIFMLLNLRDIRIRNGLNFNITAEMRRESNQNLVVTDDNTDFVVASNMSSLFLAQLSESPELLSAFSELLSNEGNELFLKEAGVLQCAGERSVAEIRKIALMQKYVVIGYVPEGTGSSTFNPGLNEVLTLKERDKLIVIGES